MKKIIRGLILFVVLGLMAGNLQAQELLPLTGGMNITIADGNDMSPALLELAPIKSAEAPYLISVVLGQDENTITYTILGLKQPAADEPATFLQALNFPDGEYTLVFVSGEEKDEYTMTLSGKAVALQKITASFTKVTDTSAKKEKRK